MHEEDYVYFLSNSVWSDIKYYVVWINILTYVPDIFGITPVGCYWGESSEMSQITNPGHKII